MDREDAYRRGYLQAWYAALNALHEGYSASDLEEHAITQLLAWRNRDHQGAQEPPPRLEQGAI